MMMMTIFNLLTSQFNSKGLIIKPVKLIIIIIIIIIIKRVSNVRT
jgi:hypothetical protein